MCYLRNMAQRIAIIGTGNVAWHLARTLENAGHLIVHIYSRDAAKAKNFGLDFFNASTGNSTDLRSVDASIFIMAISDDAIQQVAQSLQLPESAVLCHTSGTRPLLDLGYASTEHIGVFYPLQTFSKGKRVDFSEIPICVEGDTQFAHEALTELAHSISDNVQEVNSAQRKVLHLAAVFACNFTNHMFTISKEILENGNLNFDILKPLIAETLNKSFELGPENAQTGPAVRGDLETLDRQHELLTNQPELAEIYRQISQHIIDTYEE